MEWFSISDHSQKILTIDQVLQISENRLIGKTIAAFQIRLIINRTIQTVEERAKCQVSAA